MPFVQVNVKQQIEERRQNNPEFRKVINLEKYATDGRLTEPSDGKRFEWRKMIDEVKKLGRPLTEKESEEFRIK